MKSIVLLLWAVSTQLVLAQGHVLYGDIYDSFTGLGVRPAVLLLRSDSTLIRKVDVTAYERNGHPVAIYELTCDSLPQGNYLLRADHPEYYPYYQPITIRPWRTAEVAGPDLKLRRRLKGEMDSEVELEDVECTGTRIQMVYRGDTLVYNASAFTLSEGSMLDGLVRQLPGAELAADGTITIQGRKIDYLTLNGTDFFKGKNKVMLDNLPYYTVQELKVFERQTDRSLALGIRNLERPDYVMDVVLKREFREGFIGNAEVGYGNHDRWLGRAFGLMYGDRWRASLYGTANNVNETREPGQEGDWDPGKMDLSRITTRKAGLHFENHGKGQKWSESFDATGSWQNENGESQSYTETFSSAGNILNIRQASSRRRAQEIALDQHFSLLQPLFLLSSLQLQYSDHDYRNRMSDSTGHTDPNTGIGTFDNHAQRRTSSDGASWHGAADVSGDLPLAGSSYLELSLHADFDHSLPGRELSLLQSTYEDQASTSQHSLDRTQDDAYTLSATMGYSLQLGQGLRLHPELALTQRGESHTNEFLRLDSLEIDRDNSIDYSLIEQDITPGIGLTWQNERCGASLSLREERQQLRLDYRQGDLDTLAHESRWLPRLNASLYTSGRKRIRLEYRLYQSQPNLIRRMPTTSSSNPLLVRINNPHLRRQTTHSWEARQDWRCDSLPLNGWLRAELNLYRHQLGRRATYHSHTGGYTTMTDQVEGNWRGTGQWGLSARLDPNMRWRLSLEGGLSFQHNVDFDVIYDTTAVATGLSNRLDLCTLRTWSDDLRARLDYKRGDLQIQLVGRIQAWHSRSSSGALSDTDVHDYKYGGSLNYLIPHLRIALATDLYQYGRLGYQSSAMQSHELVWNATLSRPFCHAHLVARLSAYDLLHQLSSCRYSIDARGRQEYRYNNIPSYLMLSLLVK